MAGRQTRFDCTRNGGRGTWYTDPTEPAHRVDERLTPRHRRVGNIRELQYQTWEWGIASWEHALRRFAAARPSRGHGHGAKIAVPGRSHPAGVDCSHWLVFGTGPGGDLLRRTERICYREPTAKYVSFRNFPFDHNECDFNLIWHYGQPLLTGQRGGKEPSTSRAGEPDEWTSWQSLGMDRHSIIADPLFVDAGKDDYRLQPTSPAFKLGFRPIPVEKIGPYAHELRASWPIVEAEGAREKPLVIGG